MKRKGMSVGGRVVAGIMFVILTAITVIQIMFIFDMGDKGVYHLTQKDFVDNRLQSRIYDNALYIFINYRYGVSQGLASDMENCAKVLGADFVITLEDESVWTYHTADKKEYLYQLTYTYNYYDFADEYYDSRGTDYNSENTYVLEDGYATDEILLETDRYVYVDSDITYYYLDGKKQEQYDERKATQTFELQCNIKTATEENQLNQILGYANVAYQIRYIILGTVVVSLLAMMALLFILVRKAGLVKGEDGICARRIERIPLDIYLGIYLCVILMIVYFIDDNYYYMFYTTVRLIVSMAAIGIVGAILLLRLLTSLSIRIKKGKWWRNTAIFFVLKWMKRGAVYLGKRTGRWYGFVQKNIPLIWKGIAIFGIIAVIEGFTFIVCLNNYYAGFEVLFILWIIEKFIFLAVAVIVLVNLKRLQEGSEKLAVGDLSHQIDMKLMFWEFKRHGENLNRIGDGIQLAVEDRMKSERFKTELITNVSHDIKTPLTSIINYVDLLEKEDIDNPNAKEYLGILEHHSLRLKKLIEDLIEASKASSGALTVNMENFEVGVMLTQTAGEFEERLKSNQLELVIRKAEDELMIRADGRHLWRIFDNLLNNIYKYAQPGTRVYLDMQKVDDAVTIIFRNTSKNALTVSGEDLQERFVRGDSSRNTEGSGLGISIAKSLTELMHGKFDLTIDGDLFKVILTFPYQDKTNGVK